MNNNYLDCKDSGKRIGLNHTASKLILSIMHGSVTHVLRNHMRGKDTPPTLNATDSSLFFIHFYLLFY